MKYPWTLEKDFDRIFAPLKLRKFMHPMFGFELIQFDKNIQTPENQSMSDFIHEKYGLLGVHTIKQLISWRTMA